MLRKSVHAIIYSNFAWHVNRIKMCFLNPFAALTLGACPVEDPPHTIYKLPNKTA